MTPDSRARTRIAIGVVAALAIAAVVLVSERSPAPTGPPRGEAMDLRGRAIENGHAYIPSPCYTKTRDERGRVHNPCYACHQTPIPPSPVDDADVQTTWSFATPAVENRWDNLFVDRSREVDAIDDDAIDRYVAEDNYFDDGRRIRLASTLARVPPGWDENGNGRWDGYVPDCRFAFDERGFDRDPGGAPTGWRVFAYAPFLGTFFPTNGSTDDVMIRLASELREREDGTPDLDVYAVNLAIVEALVRRRDVAIGATDERRLGVDLDGDGFLGDATIARFRTEPPMSYVGRARLELAEGRQFLTAGLYPLGTEFLHSVRYLRVGGGRVVMAPHMKELRHTKKTQWRTPAQLAAQARREIFERADRPDRLRRPYGDVEQGIGNGQGWLYRGFIEDAYGDLRPQTFEETAFCIGCHSGIGATTDASFAFPRKLGPRSWRGGWYHWNDRGLEGLSEPLREDGDGEYARYLRENGAADELRANDEALGRFFDASGALRPEMLGRLRANVTSLLLPSPDRARALDKAYLVIVREQSFVRGRDPTIRPATNVHRRVELDASTGVETPVPGPGVLATAGW